MNGIELIAAERERQITKDGWPPEHDDPGGDLQRDKTRRVYIVGGIAGL